MTKRLKLSAAILLLLYVPILHANAQPASTAIQLREALSALQRTPNDSVVQGRYLAAFPRGYKDFMGLFGTDRELADGHEYIMIIPGLAATHEREVGEILVSLSQDAHYEADALSYLQDATAKYGSEHTRIFAALVKALPSTKQSQLATYLADVVNYAAYPEYQTLIDNLKTLGDVSLAEQFEAARTARQQRRRQR